MKIPANFPTQLQGPMVWDGSQYAQRPEVYTLTLTESELLGIREAVDHFKSLGLSRGSINKSNFPLPADLVEKLQQINNTLNNDRGFQLVRGIDPCSYNEEDHVIIFAGLCAHIATHRNWYIDHIRHDKKLDSLGLNLRPPELPVAMEFHTDADAGPILAMFTESQPKSGGNNYLSSFWRVYNTLLKENPQVINELAASWHWEKPNRENLNGPNYVLPSRPVIAPEGGKMEINFSKTFVAGHPKYPRNDDSPPLSTSQEAALKTLSETAKRHGFQVNTQTGDILLVNNLSIMHARDAFVDDIDSGAIRHVLRLWLQDTTSWPVSPALKYAIPEKGWDVHSQDQRLHTLSEFLDLPRHVRAVESSNTNSHD